MSKEKTVINQELCDHIKALLGGGLSQKQAAKFARISPATVSRIQMAGFSMDEYNRLTYERRVIEKNREADKKIKAFATALDATLKAEGQVQGQISMELPEKTADEEKPEMSETTKMMRFLAGKFNDLEQNTQICIGELITRVSKVEDYLGQILRRMDR